MTRTSWIGGLAAVALVVAMLGTVALAPRGAFAAGPPATATAAPTRLDRVAGRVQSTDNQSFDLRTLKGETLTVQWNQQTTCTFRDASGRTDCSQIAAKDRVVVGGTQAGASTEFIARRIVVAPPVVLGRVTAVNGADLSVQVKGGSTTTVAYDGTTVCRQDQQTIDCSTIATGDRIAAVGQPASSGATGTLLAKRIRMLNQPVAGAVTAIDGSTLTLKTRQSGTATVALLSTTQCTENAQPIDCSTIAVGDHIAAVGTTSNGTLQANRVRVLKQHVAGTATAVDGSTLTLQTRQGGTATVALLGTTQCTENTQTIDCSTIAVGDHVAAVGFVTNGTMQAQKVLKVAKLPVVRGVVQSADGRVMTVQAKDGTTTQVHWDDSTKCLSASGTIDCSTIAAGDRVAVRGTDLGADNVQAKRIAVRPAPATGSTPGALFGTAGA